MGRLRQSVGNYGRQGCGFLMLTAAFSCLFLIINAILVAALFRRFMPPTYLSSETRRVIQLAMFAMPVLMIFVEWWLVDWIVARLSRPARDRR